MKLNLKNLRVIEKFFLLLVTISVSFIVIGVFSYFTINKVKVNGEQYHKIVLGKDLIADVLPPPEYIIETYLILHEIVNEQDISIIHSKIEKCKKLEEDYLSRHDYWLKELQESKMKTILVKDSFEPAITFFNVMNNSFIPSINESNGEKAKQILNTTLKQCYEEHRKAIDEVVGIANTANAELENETKEIVNKRTFIFIILLVMLSGSFLLLLRYIAKLIEKPLYKLIHGAEKIIQGDYDTRVEITSKDEIGTLANTFNLMVDQINQTNKELREERINIEKRDARAYKISEAQKSYLAKSIEKILNQMEKFADGDLTVSLSVTQSDEIGKLYRGFNKSVANIREILKKVIEVVEAAASASNQISGSSEEMATAAQEQSNQTMEVAGAVVQMTRTIVDSTKHATDASAAARNAGEIAQEGGIIVDETIKGINQIANVVKLSAETVLELGKSSDHIGQIVQVIDDIAAQTNLLALNAAIESARAGEQGRGFAVVADEVRKLAERTTKATKEIAQMITQIQNETVQAVESMKQGTAEVEKGKILANKAGAALKQIINGSQEVVDKVTKVAAASELQASAAEQISKHIDGINSVTQEATQGIQQIARASEDLNSLTIQLQNVISKFTHSSNEHFLQPSQQKKVLSYN